MSKRFLIIISLNIQIFSAAKKTKGFNLVWITILTISDREKRRCKNQRSGRGEEARRKKKRVRRMNYEICKIKKKNIESPLS